MAFLFLIFLFYVVLNSDSFLYNRILPTTYRHQLSQRSLNTIDDIIHQRLHILNQRKFLLYARKKASSDTESTGNNNEEVPKPKIKRTKKIKTTDDVESSIPEASPIAATTKSTKRISKKSTEISDDTTSALSKSEEKVTETTIKPKKSSKKLKLPTIDSNIPTDEASIPPYTSTVDDVSKSSLISFDQDFTDLENSLKGFDLDDIDDIDGNTLRSIESGEFDIDTLMSMDDDLDMPSPTDLDDIDIDIENIPLDGMEMDFEDVLKDMNMDLDLDINIADEVMSSSLSSNEKSTAAKKSTASKSKRTSTSKPKTTATKVSSKQKKVSSDDVLESDDDISPDDDDVGQDNSEEDPEMLSLLESKESTESEIFGDDDESNESPDELEDFDFSAIGTKKVEDDEDGDDDDSDEDDGDEDDDEEDGEDGESSGRKSKKRSKPTVDKTIKNMDEINSNILDETIVIDEKMLDFSFESYSRDEKLSPSTLAAQAGYAASGQFSSKEKASAVASAAAATRAASAKRKKDLVASGMSEKDAKAEIKSLRKDQGDAIALSSPDDDKLMIDGFEVDKKLGTPPPLEEFKRLMESLGAEAGLFDEESEEFVEGTSYCHCYYMM